MYFRTFLDKKLLTLQNYYFGIGTKVVLFQTEFYDIHTFVNYYL
jgi:hypothetical protein